MSPTSPTRQRVFTRAELRPSCLPPAVVDGQACLICEQKFSGRRDAVATTGLDRSKLYAHPKCKPLFRLVSHSECGSC